VEPVQSIAADGGYFSPGLGLHGPGRVNVEREKTVKKILTALVVATGLLLTGCSSVDAALTLGDTKITTAELQTHVDSILAERAKVDTTQMQLESGETLVRNQLQFQLLLTGFAEIAKELDIQITNSEVAARRGQIVEQVGGEENLPSALVSASIAPEDLDGYLRAILTTEKLGQALSQTGVAEADVQTRVQELFIAKVNELKLKVNPRYGKWDATTGQIVAADVASDAVTPSTE
jgi:outer membrane murein-binding lipoprotein Lpp